MNLIHKFYVSKHKIQIIKNIVEEFMINSNVFFLLGCPCSGKKREIIQKTNDNFAVIPPGAQAGMTRNELPVPAVNKLRDVVSASRMFPSESAQINR